MKKSSRDLTLSSSKKRQQTSDDSKEPQPTSLLPLVNSQVYSDVVFSVSLPPPKDKQRETIYAHSFILEARAPELFALIPSKKKLEVSNILPRYLMEMLTFLYTGNVDLNQFNLVEMIEFLAGIEQFKDKNLDRLKWSLQYKTRQATTLENAHLGLKTSNMLKLESLKKFFLWFACDNYESFVNNSQAAKDLGIELFQEVVAINQPFKSGTFKKEELPPQPQDTFTEDMKRLYTTMKNPDIAFKLVDPNFLGIAGTVLRAHKAVLAAASPELAELVQKTPVTTKKGEEATIILKGITTEGFSALLKYLYYGETEISFIPASELITFCKFYNLTHLQTHALAGLKKEITPETVLIILNLSRQKKMPEFFKQEMRKLRPKCLRFIAENLPKIDLKQITEKKMHHSVAPDILLAIQKKERRADPNYGPSKPSSSEPSTSSSSQVKWTNISPRGQAQRKTFLTREVNKEDDSEEELEDEEEDK